MPVSAIIFDLGNVLLPFDYSIVIEKLNEKSSGLGFRYAEKYKQNYNVHRDYEKGLMTDSDFLDVIMEWTENKVERETFCKYFSRIFSVNERIASILPELSKNYRLFLLSNTSNIHRIYGWNDYSFLQNFEKLFLSYQVGANKPEKEIYQAVTNYTKLPYGEHLFIDDVKEYADAAKKLGWDAINFLSEQQCIDELKKRNIKF
ncbi:MAG: HAD family phosphatase [Ignavibacteria bacterium]|nr:HAD family phosphatase [Ignavibacteria bacterium]